MRVTTALMLAAGFHTSPEWVRGPIQRALRFAVVAPAVAQGNFPAGGRFPAVSGSNLNGRKFELPGDFGGQWNIVVVAFRREQQADVDAWMPQLKRLAERDERVRVYELPTLGRNYRLMRRFIDGGMAGGIPDTAVRAITITLYTDKGAFKRSLGIATEDRIQLFLVSRAGDVAWHGEGLPSPDLVAALTERLESRLAAGTSAPGGAPPP
ncbi:MAG: hypothetical protein FJ202_05185 [Gemmatimonadetes bacterium]|nr:hypothetical protein [Gemmatimonadota bacterium]